ncbi:MAG: secretion protein HlyD [Proteobacteria bacterium]|nr:MAG: secretion protein HlyD [Pseudomonadota bacterium]
MNRLNRSPLLVAALATPLALLVACKLPAAKAGPEPLVGLVSATELDVASKIPGRLGAVSVREGQRVEAGALLVQLQSDELNAKAAQAEAAIAAASARLALAKEGARPEDKRAVRSAVSAARHQAALAKKMVDRMSTLSAQKVVPEARFDEASFRYDAAMDQLRGARAKLDAVNAGARDEEIAGLEALVRQARAALDEVSAYQAETEQRAPVAGLVSKVYLHTGELAATGAPILTLVDLDDIWASFAVREDRLATIRVGDEVTAYVPALGRDLKMRVDQLAAFGEFADWRATSDKDRFDLKTFEVRLRPVEPEPALRPGMSMRWLLEEPAAKDGEATAS